MGNFVDQREVFAAVCEILNSVEQNFGGGRFDHSIWGSSLEGNSAEWFSTNLILLIDESRSARRRVKNSDVRQAYVDALVEAAHETLSMLSRRPESFQSTLAPLQEQLDEVLGHLLRLKEYMHKVSRTCAYHTDT